jgi:hypothetical protein
VRSSSKITIDIGGEQSVVNMLGRLPKLVVSEGGPLDRAVKAASSLIAKRARQLAPDSRKTGSRDKQSAKAKAKWPVRLKTTIRSKVIRYPNGAWGIVGPKSPEGNAAHFMQEKPRKHVLWGKATAIRKFRIERNWITQAFDETKSEQLSAMEASLKRDIDENMRAK